MKRRFESDYDLPLDEILGIPCMIIYVGSVFQEDNKPFTQVCLHACVYECVNEL